MNKTIHEKFDSLSRDGYVTISKILTPMEIQHARGLLWDHIESISGCDRSDPNTWHKWKLDHRGFVEASHQSRGAWFVRGLPRLKSVFKQFWQTDDLICSLDTIIAWKPYPWQAITEGLHVDQHPTLIPGFECLQGMIPLYDVTRKTGGLEVIPGSHLDDLSRYATPKWEPGWCPLPSKSFPIGSGTLVEASAGDLILWDGRTIHGGVRGSGKTEDAQLCRLSCLVTMVPRSMASRDVLQARVHGFKQGQGFTHRPHRDEKSSTLPEQYSPIKLTPAQESLL